MQPELLTVLLNILAAFGTAVFHSTAATTTTSALRSLTGPGSLAVTIVGGIFTVAWIGVPSAGNRAVRCGPKKLASG